MLRKWWIIFNAHRENLTIALVYCIFDGIDWVLQRVKGDVYENKE